MNPIFRASFLGMPMIWISYCSPIIAFTQEAAQQSSMTTDATVSTNQGLAHLLLHNYSLALDEFQQAERFNPTPETEFLIRLGQAIALDNLGNHLEASQMLASIDQTFQYDISTDPSQLIDPNEEKQAIEFMQTIARLAPSQDVQNQLLSYFNAPQSDSLYCYAKGHAFEAQKHSSKFWKKMRRICKEVLIRIISKYVEDWLKSHEGNG